MKKNKNFKIKNFFWPGVILIILVLGALWTNAGFVQDTPQLNPVQAFNPLLQEPAPAVLQGDVSSPGTALLVQEGISQVVAMVRPAVVAVARLKIHTAPAVTAGLNYIDPYQTGSGSMGSGLLIDQRGYVITTFQTVGKDNLVKVILFSGDKREYQAQVIGVDAQTDLVLLKIQAHDVFPTAVLGNSDLLETGDIVFALGSPFGFARTVTMGIVSSTTRRFNIDGIQYPNMIQTDATINEGNDGGPLVNIKGEVIGINMASFMPDNQFAGIGFAIPINNILAFLNTTAG